MVRIREHRIALNRLLKNERFHPNRAFLAEAMLMYLDADPGPEKEMVFNLIVNVWISPKRTRWNDDEDGPMEAPDSKYEREATAEIKSVFDNIMNKTKAPSDVS